MWRQGLMTTLLLGFTLASAACPPSKRPAAADAGPKEVAPVPFDAGLPPSKAAQEMSQLRLSVDAAVRQEQLVIRYTVRNDADRDVYLLNRVYRDSPPEMSPDLAYVELDPKARRIEVSKTIPAAPEGTSPTSLVAPYVTPVRAKSSFTEEIHLALPVTTFRAYGTPKPSGAPSVTYGEVQLTLGFYFRESGVTETPGTALGQAVVLPTGFRTLPAIGKLVSPPVPLEVPVAE